MLESVAIPGSMRGEGNTFRASFGWTYLVDWMLTAVVWTVAVKIGLRSEWVPTRSDLALDFGSEVEYKSSARLRHRSS